MRSPSLPLVSATAVEYEVDHKRPQDEVRNSLLKLNIGFDLLVLKDKALTSLSTDDNEFEKEEKWLTECEEYFLGIDLGMQSENPLGNVDCLTQNMYGF